MIFTFVNTAVIDVECSASTTFQPTVLPRTAHSQHCACCRVKKWTSSLGLSAPEVHDITRLYGAHVGLKWCLTDLVGICRLVMMTMRYCPGRLRCRGLLFVIICVCAYVNCLFVYQALESIDWLLSVNHPIHPAGTLLQFNPCLLQSVIQCRLVDWTLPKLLVLFGLLFCHASLTTAIPCSAVWLTDIQLRLLQCTQPPATRLAKGTRQRQCITPVLRNLQWLPVRRCVDFKLALLV